MAIQSLPAQIQDLMNFESTMFVPGSFNERTGIVRDVYVNLDKGFYLERIPGTDDCRWFTNADSHEMAAQLRWAHFSDCDEDLNFYIEKRLTHKAFTFYTSAAANGLSKNHKNSIEGELRISALGEMGEKENTISLTKREAIALHSFLSKMLA
jgi:hypothetical protein